MTTPEDEETLRRLRSLKAELDHAYGLQDRFDDSVLGGRTDMLKAEIASIPEHIRRADQIDTTLQLLTYAVEDYIIARVSQFLPDIPDLWETVKTLPETTAKRETSAEMLIVRLLDELNVLGAEETAVKNAVLRAAALDSYKNLRAPRPEMRVNTRKNYHALLRQHLAGFLKRQPQPNAAALAAQVWAWQEAAGDTAADDTFWTRYYRQAILSDIAVLQRLGSDREALNALIVDACLPAK